jgi:radical SAM superfamily enzyme YgiQ (UPF0313 family)
MIREMKAVSPEKPIVCGGEHFSGLPEFSMEEAPIDFIVLGEGEEGAVELFAALERGDRELADIDGIWFRNPEGHPTKSENPRNRIRDVDEIPWPAWDLFDVKAYDEHRLISGIKFGMTVPIMATRGCPYQCTYCSSERMWTPRWYPRNPEDVVSEIEHWHDVYGADNFPFHDLTVFIKKDWILAFCKALDRRPFARKIHWQMPSGTRIEVIDEEVAYWLRRTNGVSLSYAPESGSEQTRKRIKKRMTDESLIRAVKAAVKHRLNVAAFFIAGFPEDEAKDLKLTVKLARRLAWYGITDLAFGFFFPIPNTELYWQLKNEGRIELNDDFLLTPIFANEARIVEENNYSYHLSARQLTRWRYWTLLNFYAISYSTRPWRLVTTVCNALVGKETRKMETFLVDIRRKIRVSAKAWLTRRGRKKGTTEKHLPA